VIFGVAMVFPVVITFGVAGVLAGRQAQAVVQGFFPWSSPSALICRASRLARRTATGADKRRLLCTSEQRSCPGAGTLLVLINIGVVPNVKLIFPDKIFSLKYPDLWSISWQFPDSCH